MKKTFVRIGVGITSMAIALPALGFLGAATAHAQFEPAPGSAAYQQAQAQVPAAQAAANNSTGFTALAPIPRLTEGQTADQAGLQSFLKNLYVYCIGVAAIIAVFQIVRGGVMIAMNRDSVGNLISGKGYITQSLLGLVLVLSPALVFSIINPAILNLSVSIPTLNTPWTIWSAPQQDPFQQVQQGATPGTLTTGNKLFACGSDNTCKNAVTLCAAAVNGSTPVSPAVCTKSDGSIDPNGITTSGWFSHTYSCVAGETLNVNCSGVIAGTPQI